MPGGKGGLDIWRVRLTGGTTGGVENLGEPINTPGDEEFPTFRPNGDLYFSSNGHGGLGGLDIFIAKVGNDHRYHLEHPGYPLNSQGDDFGMNFRGAFIIAVSSPQTVVMVEVGIISIALNSLKSFRL